MCQRLLFCAFLACSLPSAAQRPAPAPTVTLVKARRLLDPRTGKALAPAAVLIGVVANRRGIEIAE